MPRTGPPNRGWFRKGFDARRHLLTLAERRRGGETWLRLYYLVDVRSGDFCATRAGQAGDLAELAMLAGDGDRPGRRASRRGNY
jgi:hypothetical protein